MKDTIDLKGASGTVYRFQRFRDGYPLSPMGGNYLYVREEPMGGFTVIHSGEGENLLTGARNRWGEAQSDYGATELFTRLNISQATRRREHADLSEQYQPPMNATWEQIRDGVIEKGPPHAGGPSGSGDRAGA